MLKTTALCATIAIVAPCTASAEVALWPVDCLTKVLPDAKPVRGEAIHASGARGEIVSAQAAIRSDKALTGANATVTGLPGAVTLQWERFIEITRNTGGIPQDELVAVAPNSIPDPFWEEPSRDIPASFTQPLWIEVEIPRDARAGDYEGQLRVTWDGGEASLPLRLRVFDFEMPEERHLYVTNWFAFPGVPYSKSIQDDSDEYWALLAKFARMMSLHRQNVFTVDLWSVPTSYDPQTGFKSDFTRFDRWCQTLFDNGHFDRIEIWGAGQRVGNIAEPGSYVELADLTVKTPEGVTLTREQKLRGILGELEKHLQEKGWADKAMIHIVDEPFQYDVPTYRKVADVVHAAAPSLKVIDAIEAEGFGDALDVWVPKLSHLNLWYDNFRKEQERGKELWFYICCHPVGRYPNRFLDQKAIATRVLNWINYLYDLDGYLHWGLNHFAGEEPYSQEGISEGLPLGDRAIMYPGRDGPLGSVRWSIQRDSLQDYEYLWVLEDRLRRLKERYGEDAWWLDPRQRPLELCRRVVQSFHTYTRDPQVLLDTRETIANEIEALSAEPLLFVQTSPPEGSEVPGAPRMINVYGLTDPGAKVLLNGNELTTVKPSGAFEVPHWVDENPVVTIVAEKDGKRAEVVRTFRLVE
jgi:hypothetical protein